MIVLIFTLVVVSAIGWYAFVRTLMKLRKSQASERALVSQMINERKKAKHGHDFAVSLAASATKMAERLCEFMNQFMKKYPDYAPHLQDEYFAHAGFIARLCAWKAAVLVCSDKPGTTQAKEPNHVV